MNTETNTTYSWGLGECYVLGTKEDDSVFEPFNVHPKQYYEAKVRYVGCGDQHVVVLCSKNADEDEVPELQIETEPVAKPEVPKAQNGRVKANKEESKEPKEAESEYFTANNHSQEHKTPDEPKPVENDVLRNEEVLGEALNSHPPVLAVDPEPHLMSEAAVIEPVSESNKRDFAELGSQPLSGLGSEKMLHE